MDIKRARIKKDIEDCIENLYEDARVKVDRFWKENMIEERKQDKNNRSRMGVRARYRNGTLTIDWFFNSFAKGLNEQGKAEWKVFSTQIKKPTGKTMYSEGPLKKHCRDWEMERVLEYEKEFAVIRANFAGLSKACSATIIKAGSRQLG